VKVVLSGAVKRISRMPQNFLSCDREQVLLMPPSLREWLPEGHLAWFVLSSVEAMGLAPFYASYRADGHGRPAHDPAMIGLSSTGRRNAVWLMTLRAGRDNRACLDEAAVVVEARPEGGPERR
jgi:hypothetical protein